MSARRLAVVGFSKTAIDCDDDGDFASLIAHIDERFLKKRNEEWIISLLDEKNKEAFEAKTKEYLIECGITYEEGSEAPSRRFVCDHLLALAIDCMYSNEPAVHDYTAEKVAELRKAKLASVEASQNPLNYLDCSNPRIHGQIKDLCHLLGIMEHPNPEVMLRAACLFIKENLSNEIIAERQNEAETGKKVKTFGLNDFPVGLVDQKDPALNLAARCLRLLSIESLRETQTCVNETLVAIQDLTIQTSGKPKPT